MEISQAAYVELLTVTRETGQAIRTICNNTSGDLECDDGPSPTLRLRELAFGRSPKQQQPTSNTVVAARLPIKALPQRQEIEYKLDDDSAIRAQASIKSARIIEELNGLLKNHNFGDLEKLSAGCIDGWTAISSSDWEGGESTLDGWTGSSQDIVSVVPSLPNWRLRIRCNGLNITTSDKFYYATPSGITSSDFNGTNYQLVVAGSGNATSVEIDQLNKLIYWSESTANSGTENAIYRCNLDGSSKTKLFSLAATTTNQIRDIGLDVTRETIYYIIEGQIRQIDLYGENDQLVSNSLADPQRLFVDSRPAQDNPMIYWSGSDPVTLGGIYKKDLVTGVRTTIIDSTSSSYLNNVRGLTVDLSAGIIYFASNQISSMNLDGSNLVSFSPAPEDGNDIFGAGGVLLVSDDVLGSIIKYDSSGYSLIFGTGTEIFMGVSRTISNSNVATKTFTGLQPRQLIRAEIVVDEILGSCSLQLLDGLTVLNEVEAASGGRTVVLTAPVPISGEITVAVKVTISTLTAGIVTLKSATICTADTVDISITDPGIYCDQIIINNSKFNNTNGSWIGGTLSTTDSALVVNNTTTISQTFSGLDPGTTLKFAGLFGTIEVNSADSQDLVVYRVELSSIDGTTSTTDVPFIGYDGFSLEATVPSDGTVTCRVIITMGASRTALIDQLLVCQTLPVSCDTHSFQSTLNWTGTIRQPVNILRNFVRYKLRSLTDPSKVAFVYQLATDYTHLGAFCDKWTTATISGPPGGLNPANMPNISDGDTAALDDTTWAYAVPIGGVGQDNLIINYPLPSTNVSGRVTTGDPTISLTDDSPDYIPSTVESVKFYFLINAQTPVDTAGSSCAPDPATELTITLSYIRDITLKSFDAVIDITNMYTESNSVADWIASGARGDIARWEGFEFVLDNIAGTGIDQCTEAQEYSITGSGTLNFKNFDLSPTSFYGRACVPVVAVSVLQEGAAVDEIQSIVLPSPSSGTYTLTLTINGVSATTDPIPFNATAKQLRVKLGSLSITGGTRNISVTGSGSAADPFLVEFIDYLSSINIDPITGDASNLAGTAEASFSTIRNGTLDERQRLTVTGDSAQPYTLTFQGSETTQLQFNSSLNIIQGALEALPTIGVGNITVTGETTDRDSPYIGDLIFDFIGDLAAQNVPTMVVTSTSTDYIITVDWNGGVGVDEIQQLFINATGGTFRITLYDPTGTGGASATTAPIAYDATASTVKDAVVAAASWVTTDNIKIVKVDIHTWTFTFVQDLGKTNIRQCTVNGSKLTGGEIIVSTEQDGIGTREKQKIRLINTTGGTYQLMINIPNIGLRITQPLQWDSTAQEIQDALLALAGLIDDDLNVSGVFPVYLVVFRAGLGNIDRITAVTSNLVCDPTVVQPVVGPPYPYDIGAMTPEETPLEEEVVLPLRSTANIYQRATLQRYLFDPNNKLNGSRMTLRELALSRNIAYNGYNPYLKSCDNMSLDAVDFSDVVESQQSYLLIEQSIDTVAERNRLLEHIRSHRQILPMRFNWDCYEV